MVEIVRLDEQRRLLIGAAALKAIRVELAPGTSTHLWAVAGKSGQLQVLPPDCELAGLRDKYQEPGTETAPVWEASGDAGVGLQRTLAGFFRITCRQRTRGNKVRLTLPADVIDLGLLKTGEPVAACSLGEILEIWRRDRWEERITVTDMRELTQNVRELIE